MSAESHDSSQTGRRVFLQGLGASAVLLGAGTGSAVAQDGDVRITIDNVGADAWEVTAVDGASGVAPTGEENPTLQLEVGTRYVIENNGWETHPLAFRDGANEVLLSQAETDDDDDGDSGPSYSPLAGAFADDPAVDWVDEGNEVAFTLTDELAAELDNYVCTVHGAMEGSIETADTDDVAATVTFTPQGSTGEFVTVDEVVLEDGGFVAIHDETLLDGAVIESSIGVSEYLEPGTHEDVRADLLEPIEEPQTLIAMPHRDTTGDEIFTFIETEGEEDGAYLDADGDAVTDAAEVTPIDYEDPDGSVSIEAPTDGDTVTLPLTVDIDVSGFELQDATDEDSELMAGHGHFHLIFGDQYEPGETVPFGEDALHLSEGGSSITVTEEAIDELDAVDELSGETQLTIQAGDLLHNAYDLTDQVEVTVAEDEPAGDDAIPGFGLLAGLGGAVGYAYRKATAETDDTDS